MISVTAPGGTGSMTLEYEMVKETQFWFTQVGGVAVTVAPPSWSASYSVGSTPTSWAVNQTQSYSVTLTNNGNQTWPATGGAPVHLGVHFIAGGNWVTDQRYSLPNDVLPGQSVTLTMISVTAPGGTGSMTLEYEMVKETQFWFTQVSGVAVTVN
jgi:hypothetical protein